MKNMKYVYASLMAVIGIILLLSNNTIKVGFERVFAYGGGGPITVTGGKVQVSAGYSISCALTTGGGVKCWGYNSSGQLGNGTTNNSSIPVDVSGLSSGMSAIAGGETHTCALTSSGGVKCWGSNFYGQLGNGTSNNASSMPVDVSGLMSGIVKITAGVAHTCALTSSGGVKCWGMNDFGQLGDGTTSTGATTTPVDVSGLSSGVIGITTGYGHTCALTSSGGVKCWGMNDFGQLGNGTTNNSSTPVDVSGLMSGMVGATSGNFHTCGITTGGGAKCWGYNAYGQLGDGTTNNSSTPVDVSGLSSGVIGITTGDFHTCGITSSGGIKCWGDNLSGQLGDGTTSTGATTTPVSVLSSVGGSPINIFTAQTRETSCGTQPANTSINTPSSKLTFTQNSTDGGTTWVPTSKSWTYSGTIGECNYSCVNGYSWNGSSCVLSGTGILSSPTGTGILSSPTIVSPTGTINTNTPIYSGSGGSGAIRVEIQTVVGTLIASGASTSTGYSLTPVLALSEGLNTFLVTGYDSLGMSGTTVTGTVIVDSIAPANPIILSHGSGAVVQSQSFTLTGTAESGSTVKVTVSSGNIYSGLADTAGNWSILVNFPLGIVYPIFTATDTIGNMSTGVTLTMTVTNSGSTTLVSTPFVTSHTSGMSTAISAVTLSGTATVGNIVNIYSGTVLLSSAQANIYGIWATTVNLISGQNTLTLYATDTLGNRSYSIGLTLYFTGLVSFSGITITSPISSGTYSYSNIVANGKGTPGNTLVVSTPSGTISGLIDATGSWSVQITLVTGTNTLTFYERTPAGILSSGLSLTVTYNQGGGGTINPSTYNITPIGSYIPSKNDLSVVDHSRLDQLPSDSVCALDEHVKLNRIITTDITGIWAEGYVRTLIRFWVIKNTENFYPNKSITRGEFLALVVRSLRCNYAVDELDAASTTSFSDVPEGHFANKYLAIAEQHGWLPSNISTRFRPDIFITRAEAIDIVRGATGLSDATGVDGFSDISRLSADIQDAILTAEKYDIVHGIQRLANWYFYPNNPLTRAEAAKIIQRTFVR